MTDSVRQRRILEESDFHVDKQSTAPPKVSSRGYRDSEASIGPLFSGMKALICYSCKNRSTFTTECEEIREAIMRSGGTVVDAIDVAGGKWTFFTCKSRGRLDSIDG